MMISLTPLPPIMTPLPLSMPMMVPLTPLTSQYAYDDIPYPLTSHNDSFTSQYAYDGTPNRAIYKVFDLVGHLVLATQGLL